MKNQGDRNQFDKYAEKYDALLEEAIGTSGYDSSYFDEQKIKEIFSFISSKGAENTHLKILNFGCGIGKSERYIKRYFPGSFIYSIDTSQESIRIAEEKNEGLDNVVFSVFDGFNIPCETRFDIILIANVLHHIPFIDHVPILRQLYGKLDDNGYLFIFEHNPFNPVTRKIVNSCEFDKDANLLNPIYASKILSRSGFKRRKIRFTIFFPRRLSFAQPIERLLRNVPIGAQYYFIAQKI